MQPYHMNSVNYLVPLAIIIDLSYEITTTQKKKGFTGKRQGLRVRPKVSCKS